MEHWYQSHRCRHQLPPPATATSRHHQSPPSAATNKNFQNCNYSTRMEVLEVLQALQQYMMEMSKNLDEMRIEAQNLQKEFQKLKNEGELVMYSESSIDESEIAEGTPTSSFPPTSPVVPLVVSSTVSTTTSSTPLSASTLFGASTISLHPQTARENASEKLKNGNSNPNLSSHDLKPSSFPSIKILKTQKSNKPHCHDSRNFLSFSYSYVSMAASRYDLPTADSRYSFNSVRKKRVGVGAKQTSRTLVLMERPYPMTRRFWIVCLYNDDDDENEPKIPVRGGSLFAFKVGSSTNVSET